MVHHHCDRKCGRWWRTSFESSQNNLLSCCFWLYRVLHGHVEESNQVCDLMALPPASYGCWFHCFSFPSSFSFFVSFQPLLLSFTVIWKEEWRCLFQDGNFLYPSYTPDYSVRSVAQLLPHCCNHWSHGWCQTASVAIVLSFLFSCYPIQTIITIFRCFKQWIFQACVYARQLSYSSATCKFKGRNDEVLSLHHDAWGISFHSLFLWAYKCHEV